MQKPPNKIRLIPDEWHIEFVGKLGDGRLFFIDRQLHYNNGVTKDFVCKFVFDTEGKLLNHTIELLGERGTYPQGAGLEVREKMFSDMGSFEISDIWIQPFQINSYGLIFGFVPRSLEEFDEDEWRVEFMPGNTLSFYAPWESGGYDT